jgi:Zn-dependent peptidase ImmA (M78 family)
MLLERVDNETRKKIESLIAFYKQNGGGIPVDFEIMVNSLAALIKKCIVTIFKEYSGNAGGYVWPVRGGFMIGINIIKHLKEQRLTRAHEISHILYSYLYSDDYNEEIPRRKPECDSTILKKNPKEEDICDEIAIYLLCPPTETENFLQNRFRYLPQQLKLFRKIQKPLDIARLEVMAEIFEVPLRDLAKHLERQFSPMKIREILAQFS